MCKLQVSNLHVCISLLSTDGQLLLVIKEEPLSEQEENPSLDQENLPGLLHIKQEQEELWTIQEGEQLRGLEEADVTKFTFTPVPVKSEEDDEENPLSSQLHPIQSDENGDAEHLHLKTEADGEDCGGSVLARDFNPDAHLLAATHDKTVHTGEKPFSCPFCDRRFAHSSGLTSHIRVHTGEKPFTCSVCKASFSFSSNLSAHMRMHTADKPFGCTVCEKTFSRKEYLTQHLTVHMEEKPFSCSVCGKGFRDGGTLKRHLPVHTGEKPFNCSVCSKGFADKRNLTRHLKIHNREKCVGESSGSK
uniref:C2H2-type domain-containing protein n=1 Tax=Dicentrarchus labrax TaxID=13489 RepID=A0A8P4KFB8_DICLA